MERLRCGVILLPAFIEHIQTLCAAREDELLPAIDYINVVDGPRKGDSWWSLTWTSDKSVRASNLFKVGEHRIYISPQTQKALKHRYIDFRNGGVYVG